MKGLLVFAGLCVLSHSIAQQTSKPVVLPLPLDYSLHPGQSYLSLPVKVLVNDTAVNTSLRYFYQQLKKDQGLNLAGKKGDTFRSKLILTYLPDTERNPEAYNLSVHDNIITIEYKKGGSGHFYAIQTLLQIIATQKQSKDSIRIPNLTIQDRPRFSWRGMHLDVSRHFFSIEEVKRYIDLLAFYKFNTFHWHLSDDQGWRIEIKKYPRLTAVGAWRKGSMVGKYADQRFDTLTYGGFYTQEQIREVVHYAAQRQITIVPEIEMPGHALAALAAYPNLSCTGQSLTVQRGWGVFEDVFCNKDETMEFLFGVLDEVLTLFPGKYIHIGGDECPKTRWKSCSNCQSIMRANQLKNEEELQSYFVRRVEAYVNAKGRQIIGWDEILEGGLAPNAAVMSWRGEKGGIEAARMKHKVVMCPGKPCYFDHYQSQNTEKEPIAIGGYNPLDAVYIYDPLPPDLKTEEQPYIMGAQGNLWTEYILNESHLQYMALPRMIALSEALWTKKELKNYDDFILRLNQHSLYLDRRKINYAPHFKSQ